MKKIESEKRDKLPYSKEEFHDLKKLYKTIDYNIPNMSNNLFENSSLLVRNNMLKTYFMFKSKDSKLKREVTFLDNFNDNIYNKVYNCKEPREKRKSLFIQYKRLETQRMDNLEKEVRKHELENTRFKESMKEIHMEQDQPALNCNRSTKSVLYKSARSIANTTIMTKNSTGDASAFNSNKYEKTTKKTILNPILPKKTIKLAMFKKMEEVENEARSSRKQTSDFNSFRKGYGINVIDKTKKHFHIVNSVNSIDYNKRTSELEYLYNKFSEKDSKAKADSIYKYFVEYTDRKNLTSNSFAPGEVMKNIHDTKNRIGKFDVSYTFTPYNDKANLINQNMLDNIKQLDKTLLNCDLDMVKCLNEIK